MKGSKIHITFWQSIDFVPAWNYLKVQETADVRYLIKGIDYEVLPSISAEKITQGMDISDDLDLQCFQFRIDNSRKSSYIFDLRKKIETLKYEYLTTLNLINYLQVTRDPEIEAELEKKGYRFKDGDFSKQLKSFANRNENIKIRINRAKEELNVLTGIASDGKINIERISLNIDSFLNRDVDLKKISLRKYLTIEDEINKAVLSKKMKENGRRK